MHDTAKNYTVRGKSLGFVPTMGALHEGHMSLIRRSCQENDITVVSVFVNPLQFGPSEDFQQYPRDFDSDSEKLRTEDVDILFLPDHSSMYPETFDTYVEVGDIAKKLCGAFRPGHFRGVATVVVKLFNTINPVRAYFGQKDFQQTRVVRQMVRDLDMNIEIIVCPTVREKDGFAMSSRNAYLDAAQRNAATVIFKSMNEASESIKAGERDASSVQDMMRKRITAEPLVSDVDYIGIYDTETLDETSLTEREVLLAVAVRIGKTRLIDNMIVDLKKEDE
jgi:pantoate--beta-alanine ligase